MKTFADLKHKEWILPLILGVAVGILRLWLAYQIRPYLGNGAGDFTFATRIAHDIWDGRDTYAAAVHPMTPDSVSYPIPAGIVAMPFALFSDEVASALFMGLSCFILAWCLLQNGKTWQLLVFLSWPFAYALLFAQWTPLLMSLWFLPAMLPLILVKPQIALPLVLTGKKISKAGILLTAALLLISLIIYPTWPLVWIKQTGMYKGLPPLFSLPLGPLILLALFKYRDRRAWLLVLFALMPQRVLYDQLPLLLIATNSLEMVFLVFCSWLTLPMLMSSGGWSQLPFNWQFWILLTLYVPGLVLLFLPDFTRLIKNTVAKKVATVNPMLKE